MKRLHFSILEKKVDRRVNVKGKVVTPELDVTPELTPEFMTPEFRVRVSNRWAFETISDRPQAATFALVFRTLATRAALATLVVAFSACGPVYQAVQPSAENFREVNKLALVIPTDGSFTVIQDRATATATPAILFGLIGAAVASAHNQSLDNDKINALTSHLAGFSSRSIFIESFNKTVKESGRAIDIRMFEKELDTTEAKQYDAVITLNIRDWGLRLASRDDERLAGFVESEISMVRTQGNQTLWDEHDTVLGHGRRYFSEYRENANMLRNELRETIQRAGARTATKIVYPKERTK